MADAKIRGKLPEGDENGLKGDAWRKRLIGAPLEPHVAIVVFDAPTATVDYETAMSIPTARLLAFEPIDGPAAEVLLDQRRKAAEARTAKTTLDIPDEEPPAPPAPKELAASVLYFFLIRKSVAGRFALVLATGTGAELGKRGNLLTKEHDGAAEAPDGPLTLEQLPESLTQLGRVLIDEHEGVVDAEVVEDEPTDEPEPEADDAGDDEQ